MSQETVEKASGLFSRGITALKFSFSNIGTALKRGWIIITLASALIGASGYIVYLNHKADQAHQQLAEELERSDNLKKKTEELIQLNNQNTEILNQIQRDKQRISILVEDFNTRLSSNNKVIAKIGTQVATLKDGELAPVLRQTIEQIQKLRASRELLE